MKLEKVSVSQIAAFDPTQPAGCPRRWWFRYVDGRKEPETAAKARGTDFHKEIEHYLLTGEDVLRPEVRVGKHLIDRHGAYLIETPIPDVVLHYQRLSDFGQGSSLQSVRFTGALDLGVYFGDTYLIGRMDRVDLGGNHLDGEGNPIGDGFPEILDWKTTSSITAYAKSGAQLATDPQMIGYASALLRPDDVRLISDSITHVRLSHVYFQTKGARAAAKRTIVVSREHVTEGYHRLCGVVDNMRKVASLPIVDDVPKNLSACSAYGGCPHAAYCPKTSAEALRGIWSKDMSLADKMRNRSLVPHAAAQPIASPANPPQTPAPAAAHAPTAQDRAALLRAELAKLEQESESAADDDATCAACGEDLTIHNLSKLLDGTIRHIGCKQAPAPITPPDQPPITQRFEPVPAETVPTLPPAVRVVAESAPAPAPVEKRGPGRPRKPRASVPMTPEQVAEHVTPAAAPVQEIREAVNNHTHAPGAPADLVALTEKPGHQSAKAIEAQAGEAFRQILASEQAEASRPVARVLPVNILIVDSTIEIPPQDGATLTTCNIGPELDAIASELARKHNAAELRCAPSDGPLSFGKWKGALSAVLRECFTPRVTTRIHTVRVRGDEVREVAVQAIASKFDVVIWGSR